MSYKIANTGENGTYLLALFCGSSANKQGVHSQMNTSVPNRVSNCLPLTKRIDQALMYMQFDKTLPKLLIGTLTLFFIFLGLQAQDETFNGSAGCNGAAVSGTWTVPCNVTSVTIELYGGGGGAGGGGGGSGGGICDTEGGGGAGAGGFTTTTINVVPGSSFSYSVGAGGCGGDNGSDFSNGDDGANGGNSSFSGTDAGGAAVNLAANGGARGRRGESCVGGSGNPGSGGAGGSASGGTTNTNGGNGGNGNGSNGGTGGGAAGPSGGNGGNGSGGNGTMYGGGGGGGGNDDGGNGGTGGLLITYVTTIPPGAAPTVTTTPPTCTDDGTSTIDNYNAAVSYTFNPAGATAGAGGLISGMTLGTNYTVAVGVGACASAPSAPFSNLPALGPPADPTVTTTPPDCNGDGLSTISNYNASVTYVFNPAGPSAGAGGTISGMTIGTSYTISSDDGSCQSGSSAPFSIAAQLATPPVPTITSTAPTCVADGSSTISNYDGSLSYAFTPAGPTAGAGGAINGMTTGTNYTVTADNGNCISAASASFSNAASAGPPADPTITSTPPDCSNDGTSTISNYDGSLTYNFTPAGPTVAAGGLISGMMVGTSYTVIADDGSCQSGSSASFSNAAQLATPPVPTITSTAPTCVADGSSAISNYDGALTYVFSPAGPTAGAGGAISGMTTGTNYTVTADNGNCTSAASASFLNAASAGPPADPTITGTPPDCSNDGTSTISNYDGSLTYNFTPAGPTVAAGGLINGMMVGTSYTVLADDGSCQSGSSASFSNAAQLATPPVPTITSTPATCVADGSSAISNYDGSLSYVFTPAGPSAGPGGAISGMTTGTSYTITADNGDCISASSASFVNDPMGGPPADPTVSTTSANCSSDGTATITNFSAALSYVFSPSGPTAVAGGVISGLQTGTSYTVIADDGSCQSGASAAFTVDAQLAVPTASISGSITYCAGRSTTLTASGGTGYSWTDALGSTISTTDTVNVQQGTYTVVVSNTAGCSDTASATVTESASLTVTINGDLDYCRGDSASLFATGGTDYTWNTGSTNDSITVIQGTYSVTATDGSCSGTASVVVNESASVPLFLGDDQIICDEVSTTIDAGSSYSTYTWNTNDTTRTIDVSASGAYAVTVSDVNGCTDSARITIEFSACPEDYVFIPTAFTPNGDGVNDLLQVFSNRRIAEADLKVFNRWGELVFESFGMNFGWNGVHRDIKAPMDTYMYVAEVELDTGERVSLKGQVTLLR